MPLSIPWLGEGEVLVFLKGQLEKKINIFLVLLLEILSFIFNIVSNLSPHFYLYHVIFSLYLQLK